MEARALVAWLEGDEELDLEAWRHRMVCGRRPAVPFGRRTDLSDQLEMLAEGFVGECGLVWVHAALNVALRRGVQSERNARRFLALWQGHADLLLELLDARWSPPATASPMSIPTRTRRRWRPPPPFWSIRSSSTKRSAREPPGRRPPPHSLLR